MDVTQAFFAKMLEKDYLRSADQQRGRFRTFLLTTFKRFQANERDRQNALKRGGGQNILSLSADEAEARYRLEPQDETTAEQVYERRWAITLLDRVLRRLRDDYHAKDKAELFDQCQVYLTATSGAARYAEVGQRLGMSEGSIKVAVHRLRQRYRDLLQEEVAQTLEEDGDIEEELAALLTAVRRS
jgi:RNA polymerase sigma-70 factor (ECF subfamily)